MTPTACRSHRDRPASVVDRRGLYWFSTRVREELRSVGGSGVSCRCVASFDLCVRVRLDRLRNAPLGTTTLPTGTSRVVAVRIVTGGRRSRNSGRASALPIRRRRDHVTGHWIGQSRAKSAEVGALAAVRAVVVGREPSDRRQYILVFLARETFRNFLAGQGRSSVSSRGFRPRYERCTGRSAGNVALYPEANHVTTNLFTPKCNAAITKIYVPKYTKSTRVSPAPIPRARPCAPPIV